MESGSKENKLAQLAMKIGKWLLWVGLTTAGLILGFALGIGIAYLFVPHIQNFQLSLHSVLDWKYTGWVGIWAGLFPSEWGPVRPLNSPAPAFLFDTLISTITGICLGAAQWFMLRKKKLAFFRWVLWSALGYLLCSWAVLLFQFRQLWIYGFIWQAETVVDHVVEKFTIIVFLFSFGFFQWIALRKIYRNPIGWIVWIAPGWLFGKIVLQSSLNDLIGYYHSFDGPLSLLLALLWSSDENHSLLTGLGFGILLGIFSGFAFLSFEKKMQGTREKGKGKASTFLLILALLICIFELGCREKALINREIVSKQVIAQINWFKNLNFISISPDNQHVALVYADKAKSVQWEKGRDQYIMLDDKTGKHYDTIEGIMFSPDSKRLAYAAEANNKWFVVIDGNEEKHYDQVRYEYSKYNGDAFDNFAHSFYSGLIFSPDSQHLAYAAYALDKWFVVLDGSQGIVYDNIGEIIFSPDSKHIAYSANLKNKWFIVLDNDEKKQYDKVNQIIFSPDSKHLVYIAYEDEKTFAVIDDQEQKKYVPTYANDEYRNSIDELNISPDNSQFAYLVNNQFAVINGIEGKTYERIWGFAFSPDNRRMAYLASHQGNYLLIVNGQETKLRNCPFSNPVFSPDSKHIAFAASSSKQIPGKEPHDAIILDGQEGKPFEIPYTSSISITFSSDSQHLAYIARTGSNFWKECIMVDGEEGNKYHFIFSAPGNEIVPETNGQATTNGKITFDSPDTIHYVARNGNKIYSVTERLGFRSDR